MNLEDALIRAPFVQPVSGFCTTRAGGVSEAPFDSLNLGAACGDEPAFVDRNRQRLRSRLPAAPCWLQQVHGARVIHLDQWRPGIEADAAWTDVPGQVVAILTADCLPILVADPGGRCIAAIHAGWRGLVAGVIEQCISSMPMAPKSLVAWIGPRICARHYEVDATVRNALDESPGVFFRTRPGHWLADLPAIAKRQLQAAGLEHITDSALCTAGSRRFFSYRRDGRTGRMATLGWIAPEDS